jgi:hypothetical protein
VTLSSVIETFATGIYTVTRQGPGSYDENGRAVSGELSEFTIRASVQPVTGQELKVLPEARHGEELRAVYTTTPLRTHGPAGAADRLSIDGAAWEVIRAEAWPSHCRAYVARVVSP